MVGYALPFEDYYDAHKRRLEEWYLLRGLKEADLIEITGDMTPDIAYSRLAAFAYSDLWPLMPCNAPAMKHVLDPCVEIAASIAIASPTWPRALAQFNKTLEVVMANGPLTRRRPSSDYLLELKALFSVVDTDLGIM